MMKDLYHTCRVISLISIQSLCNMSLYWPYISPLVSIARISQTDLLLHVVSLNMSHKMSNGKCDGTPLLEKNYSSIIHIYNF